MNVIFYRGIAYDAEGESDNAITDYNRVIQLQPDHVPVYVNRGNIYAVKGKSDLAISDYTRAIQLNPLLEISYYNRGNVYGSKKNFDMALADLNTTIQLNPRYAKAYYSRAKVWLHQQKWEKARVDLTDAKKMNLDISVLFRNDYQNILDFEEKIGIKLPDDIATMLMLQEQKTRTQLIEGNLFQSSKGISSSLEEKEVMLALQEKRTKILSEEFIDSSSLATAC